MLCSVISGDPAHSLTFPEIPSEANPKISTACVQDVQGGVPDNLLNHTTNFIFPALFCKFEEVAPLNLPSLGRMQKKNPKEY